MTSARASQLVAAGLLLLLAALTAGSAARLGETTDELILWGIGGPGTMRGDWSAIETTYQGPLPLYANQLLAPIAAQAEARQAAESPGFEGSELFRARLGMLPFALLAGLFVWRIATRVFGRPAGLLALACFVLHPLTSGYGALVAVDVAFTAAVLGVALAALRHAERPTLARAAAVGLALGLALATKYLALLAAPAAAASVLAHAARAARARRARAAAAAALALAATALLALHAAYGFRAGLASLDPARYRSDAMRAALDAPLAGRALALLPAPMARGLDYQLDMGESVPPGYFAGAYDDHHPLYHVVGFLVKSPEVQVAALALALALGLSRWLGRAADPRRRAALWLLAGLVLIPFLYLSLLARLQVGIRYVLPCLPVGCVLIGGLLDLPLFARRGARRFAVAALVLGSAASLASAWPNGLGYFNLASGGPGRAWRLYVDSNADWGQMRALGEQRLRARYPDLEVVGRGHGPRLGRVAVYVRFRAPRDPEDPARARHWVDALPQIAHEGAAWLVYDASPEAWRAAADRDPRARADLAVALLGAGRLAEAEREIAALDVSRGLLPQWLLDRIRQAEESPSPASAAMLAGAWLAADRPDLAWELARGVPGAHAIEAQALVRLERLPEAVRVLEAIPRAAGEAPDEVLLLAELYRRTRRARDGIALLSRHLPALEGEPRERALELLGRLEDLDRRWAGPSNAGRLPEGALPDAPLFR